MEETREYSLKKRCKTIPSYSYRIAAPGSRLKCLVTPGLCLSWKVNSRSSKRSFLEFLDKQSEEDYDDCQPPLKKFKLEVEPCSNDDVVDVDRSDSTDNTDTSIDIVDHVINFVLTNL